MSVALRFNVVTNSVFMNDTLVILYDQGKPVLGAPGQRVRLKVEEGAVSRTEGCVGDKLW